jgi:MFS family permease
LAAIGQNGAFVWCSALIALGFPSLFALGNASFADEEAASDAAPWWRILGQRPGIAASVSLFAIFDAVVLGLLPLYAEQGGLSASLCLMSASVALAGDTLLEWAVGAMSDAIGCRRSQWICALALFAMAPAMPFALGTAAWWPLLFLIGGAAGGLYVLAMVECGQAYTGARLLKATALLGSVWGGASIAGPLGAGALMASIGSWSIPLLLAGLALLLMAAMAAERFAFKIKTTTRNSDNDHAKNNV